jgi:hypothetical protein
MLSYICRYVRTYVWFVEIVWNSLWFPPSKLYIYICIQMGTRIYTAARGKNCMYRSESDTIIILYTLYYVYSVVCSIWANLHIMFNQQQVGIWHTLWIVHDMHVNIGVWYIIRSFVEYLPCAKLFDINLRLNGNGDMHVHAAFLPNCFKTTLWICPFPTAGYV